MIRALYAATKHAVEGYSESLDHELRTRGIRVSIIEPAYTKTHGQWRRAEGIVVRMGNRLDFHASRALVHWSRPGGQSE